MKEDFARTLALLRQERGISQRQAANALGVSQALLSHYENGLREPGLNFVVKACDFYNVSADFLLGRTLSRDGTTIIDADSLYDVTGERDHILQGSVMATLARKLVANSVGVLFDLLGKLGNKQAIKGASNYLSTAVYILFRYFHQAAPEENSQGFFSVPESQFVSGLPLVDMYYSESQYLEGIYSERKSENFPDLSHDAMSAAYPGTYQSLLQIVHSCGERLNTESSLHREHVK